MRKAGAPPTIVRARYLEALRRFSRGDFVRQGALVFGASMLTNVINYAFQFSISRILSVAQYGTLSSLLAAVTIASVPATILTLIVVKYTAEFYALEERGKIRRLAEKAAVVSAAGGVVLLISCVVLARSVADYLRIDEVGLVWLGAFVVWLSFATASLRGILQGMQRFRAYGASLVVESMARVALGAPFAIVAGVRGALAGFAIGGVLAVLVAGIATWRQFDRSSEPIRLDYRRLFTTTGGVAAATFIFMSLSYSDVLMVKHYFDAQAAGTYSAISLAGKILLFAIGFVPILVLPRATALVRAKRSPFRLLGEATLLSIAISASALLLFALFSGTIIRLTTGAKYLAAAQYLFPYALAMTLLGYYNVVAVYKISLHRFDFVMPAGAIAACEIIAITRFHTNLGNVVHIVLAGNLLAFAASLYGITEGVETTRGRLGLRIARSGRFQYRITYRRVRRRGPARIASVVAAANLTEGQA